jgi:polyisoprenoid-binding protein YceI
MKPTTRRVLRSGRHSVVSECCGPGIRSTLRCRGELHFDPTSNAISGEIVFDATSGNTDNDSRNKKMNKDVLESQRYPEITFKPSHVDGKVAAQESSTVQVKGMFGVHGSEHEITVPADVKFEGDHWSASVHIPVPYAQWA